MLLIIICFLILIPIGLFILERIRWKQIEKDYYELKESKKKCWVAIEDFKESVEKLKRDYDAIQK